MSKEFVIDLQAAYYSTHLKAYIIKELTLVSLDNPYRVLHFLVKPPHEEHMLSFCAQFSVDWLRRNHHHIEWSDGDIDEELMFKTLTSEIASAKMLYVKGKEKSDFIRRKTGKPVTNLDAIDCPQAKNLEMPYIDTTLYCPLEQHNCMFKKKYSFSSPSFESFPSKPVCSLVQALKFHKWLKNREKELYVMIEVEKKDRVEKKDNVYKMKKCPCFG